MSLGSRILSAHEKATMLRATFQGLYRLGCYHEDELQDHVHAGVFAGFVSVMEDILNDISAADDGDFPVELYDYDPEDLEKAAKSNRELAKRRAEMKKAPEPQPESEDSKEEASRERWAEETPEASEGNP